MKILFFDLETAPLLAHIWRLRTEYVNPDGLLHDTFLISWAAKWRGEKKFYSQALEPGEAQAQNDNRLVEGIAEMVREADVVVAHNIDRFDLPVLNGRLLGLRLEPLGPVQTIDTKKVAKREFNLASSSLEYLAEFLGHGKKIKTDFELWRRAYLGEPAALRKMLRYNRRDVKLLELVFEDMLPYIKSLPRLVDGDGSGRIQCVYCKSTDLIKRGYRRTSAGTYQQWQCKKCQRYSKSASAEEDKKLVLRPT